MWIVQFESFLEIYWLIDSNLLFGDSCIMSSPSAPLCLLGTHNIQTFWSNRNEATLHQLSSSVWNIIRDSIVCRGYLYPPFQIISPSLTPPFKKSLIPSFPILFFQTLNVVVLIASAKSRSARGASHQPAAMVSCLTISHTFALSI